MNINIKVYLHAKETNFLQSGSFPIVPSDYRKDPDWTAANTAYEWIQQIKINFAASKDFRIDQVVYNDDIDITELVKKVKPIL
ncbi:hypothetical protein [Peribacillus sp. ACCC06369]|uniref:hypothetical protein n=1 Tax=Peribacillus sp. ACCC06369 TaxID=3055860 RepID=UPI0025A2269F|nr:hypothetical protein [Peribacillus sp. ACCC06369]MDM5358136.1 hypothetical protein [Peribacillus sp. ACCC06369]